jgi:hypothetical protein
MFLGNSELTPRRGVSGTFRKSLVLAMLTLAIPGVSLDVPQPPSSAETLKLFQHHGTVAWSVPSSDVRAFIYEAGMAVDADGAYRAYHPKDLGLDSIDHAGYPGHWWALATDNGKPSGRPVIQRRGDPAPGYYVSMTSLYDADIPSERNPHRFVDAAHIPYVVLPPIGFKHAKLGDFATVINLRNGRAASAIVADESAPDLQMGEGSIALAKALGIDPNPRTGGTDDGVAYVIYPGSGNGKPRSLNAIALITQHHFQVWGGRQKLKSFLRSQGEESVGGSH